MKLIETVTFALLRILISNVIFPVGLVDAAYEEPQLRISEVLSEGDSNFVNITGLILARGGSKGIPLKNLANFKGKSLLRRAILSMKKFGKFSSIWVSTDNKAIAREAESLDVFVHWRSAETSSDTAPSLIAVQEFCSSKPGITFIGLIQCTSPFLSPSIIDDAYDLVLQGYDSVFTVTREHKLRWRELSHGIFEPLNFDMRRRPRRQDWCGDIVENGMLYFTRIDFISSGLLQGGRMAFVEVPNWRSIEIDCLLDLRIAEIIYDAHLSNI